MASCSYVLKAAVVLFCLSRMDCESAVSGFLGNCEDGWTAFNNSCYKVFSESLTWVYARVSCLTMKADLASISSIDENKFLSKLSGQSVWIGLNSIVPVKQRRYVWSDSTPLSFLSHGIDRGSNLGVVVLEGASEKEGYWTRMSCNDSSSYICQKAYKCNDLREPENGVLHPHNTSVGSEARFSCNSGYKLHGNSTLVCQQNSLWSASPPACLEILTLFLLKDDADYLTFKNFTSQLATSFADNLIKLTQGKTLNTSELEASNTILNTLVTLQEDALEEGINVTISDTYVSTFVGASSILLTDLNRKSWLNANQSFGAPLFLETMERFSRLAAFTNNLTIGESKNVTSDNIVLKLIAASQATVEDISFPDQVLITGDSVNMNSYGIINIPSTAVTTAFNNSNADRVLVSLVAFKNLEDYMPPETTDVDIRQHSVAALRNTNEIVPTANIISASIVATSDGAKYRRNYQPLHLSNASAVYINYTLEVKEIDDDAECVFWQFANGSELGQWSVEGLTTEILTGGRVVCTSTHLTSFSVLVAVEEAPTDVLLSHITYVGCGISLVGLFVTLVCLVYLRKQLHSEKNFITINFIISLILALIFFIAGIDQASNETKCKAMTMIMHYLFLTVFCWMLCEAIILYRFVVVVFDSGERHKKKYFALGWGVPMVIVAVSVGIRYKEYGSYSYCFLTHHEGLIYAFVGPMCVIFLFNLVMFLAAVKVVVSQSQLLHDDGTKTRFKMVRSGLKAMGVLLPVLGLTWVVGVFAVDTLSRPLTYAFTILNTLQGLFVFVFHCLLNEQVRKELKLKKQQQAVRKAMKVSDQDTITKDVNSLQQSNKTTSSSGGRRSVQSASSEFTFVNPKSAETFSLDILTESPNMVKLPDSIENICKIGET
ncbi:adhesion G protein-coupled receptor L2-like [Corticium candelabrum]|uniref:adhesion G protein-coupled receptor L2-like n=1 Tax=Corticium candelabrum TaxID=121492 RepID=UPI002E2591D6|nr:adhesion G protein-coupled receptor L2-like [Corticium candelabrum]